MRIDVLNKKSRPIFAQTALLLQNVLTLWVAPSLVFKYNNFGKRQQQPHQLLPNMGLKVSLKSSPNVNKSPNLVTLPMLPKDIKADVHYANVYLINVCQHFTTFLTKKLAKTLGNFTLLTQLAGRKVC